MAMKIKGIVKIFTFNETLTVIAKFEKKLGRKREIRILYMLSYFYGLSAHELDRITLHDVDLENKSITIRGVVMPIFFMPLFVELKQLKRMRKHPHRPFQATYYIKKNKTKEGFVGFRGICRSFYHLLCQNDAPFGVVEYIFGLRRTCHTRYYRRYDYDMVKDYLIDFIDKNNFPVRLHV